MMKNFQIKGQYYTLLILKQPPKKFQSSFVLELLLHENLSSASPFKLQPHKRSNIQIIRRQQLKNCLSVFDHFVGLSLKVLSFLLNLN